MIVGVLVLAVLAGVRVLLGAARHRVSPTSPMRLCLVAYVLAVPLEDLLRVPSIGPVNGLADYLALSAMAAAAYRWLSRPDDRVPISIALPAWVGLMGLAAAGYAWSIEAPATFNGVLTLFGVMGLPIALSLIRVERTDLDRLLAWLAASAALPSVVGLALLATGRLAGQGSDTGRFAIVAGDFNHTAAALLVPLAAAGTLTLTTPSRRTPFGGWSLLATLLALVAISLTVSRGGMLGVGAVGVILLVTRVRPGRRLPLAAAGVALLLVLAVPALDRAGGGTTGRSSIFRIGLEACPEHCLTGSGLSTFPAVHERVAIEAPELGRQLNRLQAHNLWLGMAVEQGVVAMALWTATIVGSLATAGRAAHPLGPAMFAAGAGLLTANLFLDGWEFKYFWMPIALGILAANSTTPRAPASARRAAIGIGGRTQPSGAPTPAPANGEGLR